MGPPHPSTAGIGEMMRGRRQGPGWPVAINKSPVGSTHERAGENGIKLNQVPFFVAFLYKKKGSLRARLLVAKLRNEHG